MKKAFALALVVGVASVALGAGTAGASPAKQADTSLVGTGATFPFPLISKWIPAIGSAFGINVTYSPTGSGTGISSITARTVDFGASDAPLIAGPADDVQGLRPDPVGTLGYLGSVQPARDSNGAREARRPRRSQASSSARSRTGTTRDQGRQPEPATFPT